MTPEEYITTRHLKLIGFEHIGGGVLVRGDDKVWFEKVDGFLREFPRAEFHNGLTFSALAEEIKMKLNLH